MKEKIQHIVSSIIKGHFAHDFPEEIRDRVERMLSDEHFAAEKDQALNEVWDAIESAKPESCDKRMLARMKREIGMKPSVRPARVLRRVAAVLVPLFVLGAVYWSYTQRVRVVDTEVEEVRIAEVTALYGETRFLILPDGTRVWINAGSTLKYSEDMGEGERIVELEGESYFAVEKDPSRPFRIKTGHLTVTVLGTQFNVEAYPDRSLTLVTLDEGKVSLDAGDGSREELTPGRQFSLNNATGESEIRPFEELGLENASGWKSGSLYCYRMSLPEILEAIERKYDVRVQIDPGVVFQDKVYTGEFRSTDAPADILDMFRQAVGGFGYRIDNGTINIYPAK